jgi:ABC-type transport system involved in multi-copper enzyme maturation permease subunit
MISRIWAIALNTFREARRNRVLWGVLVVVAGVNVAGAVLAEMTLGEEARVARDVGISGVSLFGSLTAIVLGVTLLHGEIARRTIHSIVSKPIQRWEFVLGKYLGMGITLSILVAFFTVAMALLLRFQDVPWSEAVSKAVLLAWMEVLVVAAIAVFFSSFSTPFLSGIFTFGLYFAGSATDSMREALAEGKQGPIIEYPLQFALWVIPDLHIYSISGGTVHGERVSVHGEFVDWSYVGMAGGYAALYVGMLLLLSIVIFSQRDFV